MKKRLIIIFSLSLLLLGNVLAMEQIVQTSSNVLPSQTSNSININALDLAKIQPLLQQKTDSIEGTIPIIVQFKHQLTSAEKKIFEDKAHSIKYEYSLIPAAALSIDTKDINDVAALSFVTFMEFDAETSIVLAQSTTQIGATRVWVAHGVEGEGTTIAVLDTGIDNEHPDVQNVIQEQDFTGEGTDDFQGHGTHVASIAAGNGAISGGVNKGVAPEASLLDVKVLDRTGSGVLSDTIAGIEWSVLNGADIISMSLGAQIPCNGLDATSLAADAAVARGVHVVVAAGNTGPLPGSIGSPGCARDVITVGAVDRLDNVAVFSSRGPTLDGRIKPDIVAPGVLIVAAQNGGSYTALSGTSMATPHVSGVIALLQSHQDVTPAQAKEVIMSTAQNLGEDPNIQGSGRLKAYEAFISATGLPEQEEQPPSEELKEEEEEKEKSETTKKEAEDKSKNAGHIDQIKNVEEKQSNGKEYYIIDGSKNEQPKQIIRVWVNKDTGEIERVQTVNIILKIWDYILDFFTSLFT